MSEYQVLGQRDDVLRRAADFMYRQGVGEAASAVDDVLVEVELLRRRLEGAVEAWGRIAKLAEWIERDRRESDKVLLYAMDLANLATAHGER
jgi:hypothetical protein